MLVRPYLDAIAASVENGNASLPVAVAAQLHNDRQQGWVTGAVEAGAERIRDNAAEAAREFMESPLNAYRPRMAVTAPSFMPNLDMFELEGKSGPQFGKPYSDRFSGVETKLDPRKALGFNLGPASAGAAIYFDQAYHHMVPFSDNRSRLAARGARARQNSESEAVS
jgi:hypothetical protein